MKITKTHTEKYRKNLAAIIALYEKVRVSIVEAYWLTGKHIIEIEQDGGSRAPYRTWLLPTMSADLTEALGKGFSVTNLKRMRRFYLYNPKGIPPVSLTWTQQAELLAITDASQRKALIKKAEREALVSRDIRTLVREIVSPAASHVLRPTSHGEQPVILDVQRNTPHVFSLVPAKDFPRPRGVDVVDCGFRVWRILEQQRAKGKGQRVNGSDQSGQLSVLCSSPYALSSTPSYTYPAQVLDIIDADTLWARIDCGFGVVITEKLRLRGIDAPELKTAAGERAKRFVEKVLKPCPIIVIATYKNESDKYDRYLADIFYMPKETDPQKIVKEGTFLNQELLDKGYAVPWTD